MQAKNDRFVLKFGSKSTVVLFKFIDVPTVCFGGKGKEGILIVVFENYLISRATYLS